MKNHIVLFILLIAGHSSAKTVVNIIGNGNIWEEIQQAVTIALPETIIQLPSGTFSVENEILVNTPYLTIRGMGKNKTILNFKNQKVGAQGILAMKDGFTIEDLAIEDTKGDGLKIEKANQIIIRNIRVEWTNGPAQNNGAYGLYPVQTQNILIENSTVIGASDAGIYVGQSKNIIVRGNYVFQNVAGIEIENSSFADVYENHAEDNTAGILVFDLPNLKVRGGRNTRVFKNKIIKNNFRNFAPPGNIVGHVPSGSGIMVIANDDIEIFENDIFENSFAAIILANYLVTGYVIKDAFYDPKPDKIFIHDNTIKGMKSFFSSKPFESKMHFAINYLTGFKVPDILYDGVQDGTYSGNTNNEDSICISKNKHLSGERVNFVNLHLDSSKKSLFGLMPGGPIEMNPSATQCSRKRLPKIVLSKRLKIQYKEETLSLKKVRQLCSKKTNSINFNAYIADCEKLSDYNLFLDTYNPTENPLGNNSHLYQLSAPLFTDYTKKHRFIFLNSNESMDYNKHDVFTFPVGTIISKTFSYSINNNDPSILKWLETRLLIKRKNGWKALSYVWDHKKKEAYLSRVGATIPISFYKDDSKMKHQYIVPSQNQCFSCHSVAGEISPIGPQAKLLNMNIKMENGKLINQLQYLKDIRALTGMHILKQAPRAPNYFDLSEPLNKRARAYLHSNCAHCHKPSGRARTSGLFLEYERNNESIEYGNCKPPVAAGRGAGELRYIIEPKSPKNSILVHRLDSVDPGVMMPEIGKGLVHREGVELIKKFINNSTLPSCK